MSDQSFEHILVITDGLKTSDAVHETALKMARDNNATITVANAVQEPSRLARWTGSYSNEVFEMVVADKQQRLEKCARQFVGAGVKADAKVLIGKSSEAIAREAIESKAGIVIRYRKGALSKSPGRFGNTAKSLMRFCPVPVLFVGDEPVAHPKVLACVDTNHDEHENSAILKAARKLGQVSERLLALYCWKFYHSEMVQQQMSVKAWLDTIGYAKTAHRESFDDFTEKYGISDFSKLLVENGETQKLIPKICEQEGVDVVVMCSASLNHPFKRYFGSTIESVIEEIPCSLLVVKPEGFQSPILKPAPNAAIA